MLPAQKNRLVSRAQVIREAMEPAQILFSGQITAILCSIEAIHRGNDSLGAGGFTPDYQVSFHVLRGLFLAEPAIGNLLQWRVPGEPTYRATVRIDDITDRPSSPTVVLRCNNSNK